MLLIVKVKCCSVVNVTKILKLNSELEHNICSVLVVLNFTNFNGTMNAGHLWEFRKT